MIRFSTILLAVLACFFSASGQALRDINYGFLYEPSEPYALSVRPVRDANQWSIFFRLELTDSTQEAINYLLRWDLRSSLIDKEGTSVPLESIQDSITDHVIEGVIKIPVASSPQVLVAKILNNEVKRAWIQYEMLDPNHPIDGYLTKDGRVIFKPYVHAGETVNLVAGSDRVIISYYKHEFPAAVPPFSEGMARVSPALTADTIYSVPTNEPIVFNELGLYLVQRDTSQGTGFAFRLVNDYPRFTTVESLADPMIYLCTKQEFDRIQAAEGNKKAFDKVILNITGDADRARSLMRNYFRRVEWANFYFSSYKEGWKTDRGMVFILFGLPDNLFKFEDREVWSFDNKSLQATFTFVKSSTVFDPENYVLIRSSKLRETWYDKIDLWRNARF